MLNQKTARALATKIVKESSGVVKFGETNGKICLHVRFIPSLGERSAASITIYSLSEWDDVPFPYNESKRQQKSNESRYDGLLVET